MSVYRLLVPYIFLSGCTEWVNKNPFLIPRDAPIHCADKLCCYATAKDGNREMCISSDQGSNLVLYIKVMER